MAPIKHRVQIIVIVAYARLQAPFAMRCCSVLRLIFKKNKK